ncbi:presenilin-1-like [Sycon ciliatum]|uniref:presenilin-1-like n=1 Tax=Sycon ciliatum TaxID=27933 RepID=UPI0031F6046D
MSGRTSTADGPESSVPSSSRSDERRPLMADASRQSRAGSTERTAGSTASTPDDAADASDTAVITPGRRGRDADSGGSGGGQRRRRRQSSPEDDEATTAEELRAGAKNMVKLILPVVLCMAVVCASILTIDEYKKKSDTYLPYTPYHEDGGESGGTKFGQALVNVIIILGIVVALTCVLVILIKYRCYKAVAVWLIGASVLALGWFSFYYFASVMNGLSVSMDMITAVLFGWNFCVAGVMGIHWRGPLRVQQFYLIATCVLIALIFIQYLPDWTAWLLLALIAVYDLVAVLAPFGPLRKLVEIASERDEPLMPSLVYSTTNTMIWFAGMMADAPSRTRQARRTASGDQDEDRVPLTSPDDSDVSEPSDLEEETLTASEVRQPVHVQARQALSSDDGEDAALQRRQRRQPQARDSEAPSASGQDDDDDEDKGVKLGLGDFIFYSILVGRATKDSDGDFNVILACFLAIIIGLCVTVLLLATLRKALPALPFSIAFGLIFYFATAKVITPFTGQLNSAQVFI